MTGNLQPLDSKFAIVGPDGRPTDYFTRWAQQRQIDIGNGITLLDLEAFLTAHKLVPGVGIQFAPNGDINNSPTIHADVQAILDEITATRGTILYRGLLGWAALAPGTAGNFLQTAGPGLDPLWAAGGGGGGGQHEYEGFGNLVSLAGLTKLAGASANLTLTNGTLGSRYSWTTSGANTVQMAYQAAPATPWSWVARFIPETAFAANVQFGIALRNSVNSKITTFTWNSDASLAIQNWTNPTTFSAIVLNLTIPRPSVFWFRVDNDGTTLTFLRSYNGVDWLTVTTQTLAAFMSAVDQIGIGGVPQVAGSALVSNLGNTLPS